MSLPRAIQQQIEEAERIEAALANPEQKPDPVPEPVPEQNQEVVEQPEQHVTQEEPPKAPPVEPKQPDWKQKFDSLQGKYNAEVPRLHQQLRDMEGQLHAMQAKLEAVQAPPKPEAPKAPLVTDSDREAFGPDLVDLIERAVASAKAEFASEREALVGKINRLEGQLGHVEQKQGVSDTDRFWMRLENLVPDWKEINAADAFVAWLAEVDPVYGLPRQAALDAAGNNLDADRAAAVFNAFKALTAPKVETPPRKQELQRQVAPTRSRNQSAPASTDTEKPIYTQEQIGTFYDQWRRGLIPDEQAVRIDADITAAAAEGRIR